MSDNQHISSTLELLAEKLGSGLSDLLGAGIEVSVAEERRLPKAQFFASLPGKMVMAHFSVSGSRDGQMYSFCHLKDAVLLGGTLIMLPPAELEKKVRKEEFTEEEADAFGEIVNIVSGELCQAFDRGVIEKLHFKKTGIEVVQLAKRDPAADELLPPGDVYQVSFDLLLDEKPLKRLEMVFPPALLGLAEEQAPPAAAPEEPASEARPATAAREQAPAPAQASAQGPATEPAPAAEPQPGAAPEAASPMVLVVAGRKEDVHDLTDACTAEGFAPRVAGYQEDFQPFGPGGATPVRGVVFTMDATKEQGLAAIIKAKAIFGGAVPLIAAGGQWTRSQVLQAVKYGVCDIVVIPASPDDIREKLRQNLQPKGD